MSSSGLQTPEATRAARRWEGQGADAAARAIVALREAGHNPDAVLLPRDGHLLRAMLASHPEWEWHSDFMNNPHFATLCGVPVFDPGPSSATELVVLELGASLRKRERHSPGAGPVAVWVDPIDNERATAMFDAGQRLRGSARPRRAGDCDERHLRGGMGRY